MQKNSKRLYIALCAVLFLIGIIFSLYKLTESPPFWYDEGWYVQTATNLAQTGIDGIQLAPGYIYHVPVLTVGYPLIFPMGGWLGIFGYGVLPARSFMVAFILGLLVLMYCLVRRLFGLYEAAAALALLVTFPPLYANGKSVLGEIPGMVYLALFLWFLVMALRGTHKKRFYLIVAGFAAGLCMATKPLFLPLGAGMIVVAIIERRRRTISRTDMAWVAGATILPLIAWLLIQFHGGDSLAAVLAFYSNPYNETSLIATVARNFAGMFKDPSTLFTLFVSAVWAIGLAVRNRKGEIISAVEAAGFVFSILTIVAFLRTGGLYRYLLSAQILSLAFFAPSCRALIPTRFPERYAKCALTAVVTVLALAGLCQTMFHSWVADAYRNDKTAYWQQYFEALPASETVFFYDTPEVVPFMQSRNYYQFVLAPAGSSTGKEELVVISRHIPDTVIIATAKYEPLKDSLFSGYHADKTAYKYSILKRNASR